VKIAAKTLWLVLWCWPLLAWSSTTTRVTTESLPEIVAIVDHRYLTQERLDRMVSKLLEADQMEPTSSEYHRFRLIYEGNLLQQWLEIALLASEAEKQGFRIGREELDSQIKLLMEKQQKRFNLAEALKKLHTRPDEFRQDMHDALLGEKLISRIVHDQYSEQELREFYQQRQQLFREPEQVRVAQIFRTTINKTKEEKLTLHKEMKRIRKEVLKKDNFAEWAKRSDGFLGKQTGELGRFQRKNALPAPLGEEIFNLPAGKVSDIYESRFGFHIVKVLEHEPERQLSYTEARPLLEQLLFNSLRQQRLEQIRRTHTVYINLGGIKKEMVARQLPELLR